MINIISKDRVEDIKDKYGNMVYIEFPWQLFYNASKVLNQLGEYEEIERVIREVEGCEPLPGKQFRSKFNGETLGISELSTGSKVVICIYYLIKIDMVQNRIIDITDCGSNAIKYILTHYNESELNLFLGHEDLRDDFACEFMLNGNMAHRLFEISEGMHE